MLAFPPLRFTWCNHDFIFLGADPQEREVILWIDVSHSAPCLHDEAVHEPRVLDRRGVIHSAFDRDTCRRQGTARGSDETPEPPSASGTTSSNWSRYLTSADVVTTPGIRSVLFKGLKEEPEQK